jgi:hypothetical protein
MTIGIVSRLAAWVQAHASQLKQQGIELEEDFPGIDATLQGKATIGLVFNDIVVTYTVWELTIFQTSLIVFNAWTKRTVFFKDSEPGTPDAVDKDLAEVVEKLVSGEYSRMSSAV